MFPQSPISHISAQFIQPKYRIPHLWWNRIFLFKKLHRCTLYLLLAFSNHEGYFRWIVVWSWCLVFREYLWVCSWMDGKSLWGTNSASFHHKWATERNFNGTNMRAICLWKVKIKELWFPSTLDCNVWTRRDFFWVFATWLREREREQPRWLLELLVEGEGSQH